MAATEAMNDSGLSEIVLTLISVALSAGPQKSLDQNLDVKPKAPIVDVPQIKLYSFRDMFDRWCSTSRAVALRQPVMPG